MTDLKGQVAIITGASSGIGQATAHQLADLGVNLALGARRMDRLEALQKELEAKGVEVLIHKTDVTRREDCEAFAKAALDRFGRLDILVNNAGIMPVSFIENLKVDEWERMVDINIKGVLFMAGAVLPTMMEKKSGFVVNIGSIAGQYLVPAGAVYAATKFAVRAFSEGMRRELVDKGIRVAVIEPGPVRTELGHDISDAVARERIDKVFNSMEILKPEDIARLITFILTQPNYVRIQGVQILPAAHPL